MPLGDIRELQRKMREYSVPIDGGFPPCSGWFPLVPIGPGLMYYRKTLDDLISEFAAHGAPSPRSVVVRGREGFVAGTMVMVPWESGGVLVGTAEAVSAALDDEGFNAAAAAGGGADG